MFKREKRRISGNRRLDEIADREREALVAIEAFREGLKTGATSLRDLPELKRRYPVFGIIPCKAAGIEFVMFHAHDDVVVWDYLWRGEDGYEPELVKTWVSWCQTPGTFLDIGAYSGLMSLLAARAHPENQVHLFEPLERTIERANVNIKINGLGKRIQRHSVAASDRVTRLKMNLYRDENFLATGNSIYAKEGKESFGFKEIQTVAIDDYLPGIAPRGIKIDVEGHELACLEGLEKTITRARPNMLVEVWEHSRTQVLTLLERHGYDLLRTEPANRPVNNYIATPR